MATPLRAMDGPAARRWFEHALRSLLLVRGEVDELNVFPVPDADTGTNLVLTLAAAAEATAELPADADLGALTGRAADGALLGARGSSGVILSQALQAIALEQAGRELMDGPGLAASLHAAAAGARSAVSHPVEGTILTVATAAAEAARAVVAGTGRHAPLDDVAQAAVSAARSALAGTHGSHGGRSVDAGAAGYVVVLGALADVVAGREAEHVRSAALERALVPGGTPPPEAVHPTPGEEDLAEHAAGDFEVMYVLEADAEEAARLREHLTAVGHAVAVVGQPGAGRGLWHVHVHTDVPEEALAEAGGMRQVGVRHLRAGQRPEEAPPVGVVACTCAPGLLGPLARTGAVAVLGADAAGVRRAVVDLGAAEVVVLPCGEPSAQAAAGLRAAAAPHRPRVTVHVAPTQDDVQVLTVAAELSVLGAGGRGPRPGAAEALAVVDRVRAAGRTTAVTGRPVTTEAAERAVGDLLAGSPEILTAVLGAGAGAEVRQVLREAATRAGVELVLIDGEQPAPALLLGAE